MEALIIVSTVYLNKIIEGLGEKSEEILRKVALCKNAEDLPALAKENNVAINETEAAEIFASMQRKPGKLWDDELDAVAGGGGIRLNTGAARLIAGQFFLLLVLGAHIAEALMLG